MRGGSMSIPNVVLAKVENNHLTLLEGGCPEFCVNSG